jgi:hypothetical protein
MSDVNLTEGGLLGKFNGKLMMALKYPPSLQNKKQMLHHQTHACVIQLFTLHDALKAVFFIH